MARVTPATVLALIALAISLGGNAYAAKLLITSKDIKDGTIRLVDLAPSTRAALRGQEGPMGPVGPTGPQGPAGSTSALETRVRNLESRLDWFCLPGRYLVTSVTQDSYTKTVSVTRVSCL